MPSGSRLYFMLKKKKKIIPLWRRRRTRSRLLLKLTQKQAPRQCSSFVRCSCFLYECLDRGAVWHQASSKTRAFIRLFSLSRTICFLESKKYKFLKLIPYRYVFSTCAAVKITRGRSQVTV